MFSPLLCHLSKNGERGTMRCCFHYGLSILKKKSKPERCSEQPKNPFQEFEYAIPSLFWESSIFCSTETGMNWNGYHQTTKNCEGTTGIHNRLLRGQGRSFQVTEAPRGHPFGGDAGHRRIGIGNSRNYWNCAIFTGNPQNIFLNVLWGLRQVIPPHPPLWYRLERYPPEKVLQHNRKALGGFGGKRHCFLRKQVLYHLLKNQGFTKACFFIKMPRLSAPRHKATSRCERAAVP